MRLSLVAVLAALLLASLPCRAHDDHDSKAGVFTEESIEHLEEFLSETLEESIRHGVNVETTEQQRLGRLLLDRAYAEVIEELKSHEPSALQRVGAGAKRVLNGFNPIVLGRWLLETGRRHGPALAIALGVTEVTEQLGVLASAKYPQLLFLVPLYFTHFGDFAAVTITLGAPKVLRTARVWWRHGGFIRGPAAYYRHLLAQRQILPIDWTEVVHADNIATESGEIHFTVISEGFVVRRLPRALRVVLNPRAIAQRETMPTFGIWELEKIAKANGIALRPFKVFRPNKNMYVTILLREISRNEAAAQEFIAGVQVYEAPGLAAPWKRAQAVDAADLLESVDVGQLQKHGESPDVIAQRLLWFLREKKERLYSRTRHLKKSEHPDVNLRAARRNLRKLSKILEADRGLGRIAATLYPNPTDADWQSLDRALREARGIAYMVEAELPAVDHTECARLLLGSK